MFVEMIFIRAQHGMDLSDITVDTCMKVFNRKQNRAPGSQLKYTMNFYHTTNTMTVNGWRVDIFINEISDQLCKAIQDKCLEHTECSGDISQRD
jgi:hypothetical protein